MGISENSGTPKSSILIVFSIINIHFGVPLFLETPIPWGFFLVFLIWAGGNFRHPPLFISEMNSSSVVVGFLAVAWGRDEKTQFRLGDGYFWGITVYMICDTYIYIYLHLYTFIYILYMLPRYFTMQEYMDYNNV